MTSVRDSSFFNSSSYKVLIVESPSANREQYCRCLLADESCHYTCLYSDSAAAALEQCQRQQFDGILVDDALPDASGLEFVQSLLSQFETDPPPVVLVAGTSDPAIAVRAIKSGAEDYLVKQTLTPEQLQIAMRSAIENARLRLQLRQQEEQFRRQNIIHHQELERVELELRQKVADLEQQQHRLQRLIDYAPIGVGIAAANGEVKVVNDEMLRLHGYTRAEFEQQGMNWRDFLPAAITPYIEEAMAQLRQTGILPPEERELVWRDGTIMPIWISLVKCQDGTDDHVAFAADLTRQKQTQGEIEQLNQDLHDRVTELQTLIDIAPVGIAIALDPACQQMQHNAYLRDLLGVNPGGNISKSAPRADQPAFQVLQDGREVPSEDLPMQQAARLGIEVRETELEIRLSEGTVRYLLSYATPLQNDQAEVRGVIGAFLDITDRKQIETDLYIQQEQLRLFIKHAPAGVAMFDQEMRYILASDRWLTSYRIADQAVIGRSHYDIFPEVPQRWRDIHQRCLAGATETCEEDAFPRPDGAIDWVRWEIHPWHTRTGEIGGIIIFSEVITERKRAEDRLRESEATIQQQLAELESIYATAPVGLCFQDREMRYVRVNERLAEINGVSVAAHMGRTVRDILPDLADTLERIHRQVVDTGDPIWGTEIRGTTPAQPQVDRHWISSYLPLKDANGRVLGVNVMVQDVTELRRAEVALRDSHDQLTNTLESITDAFISLDENWYFTFVNSQAANLLHQTPAELVGQNMWDMFPEGVGTEFERAYRRAMNERVTVQLEAFYPPLAAWLELRIYPTQSGLAIYFQDVTPRKVAEADRDRLLHQEQIARAQVEDLARQLDAERNRLEQVLQQMPLGVVIVEAPSGAVLFFNEEAEQILGHPLLVSETLAGYAQYGGIHPDGSLFQPEEYPVARSILRGEVIKAEEIRYRRGDGTETVVAISSAPIFGDNGQPIAVVGTIEDIAQRKQIEAERSQLLADAEAANRSKDEFVSLVAHELRSPLNAVLGWAKLLQTRSFDAATTKQALETITRNTQVQVQLIEDLLDVSRMVRGTLRLELTSVNMGDVVREAIQTIQPTAAAKGLQLQTEIHSIAPIQGDFGRLQQVMLNLLTNAIKFTPADGQISVRLDQHETQLRLQVSDTGKGISPAFLPFVFERFRQDDQNATTKQGLGLGLAIVQYIIQQHGGSITAASEGEGQGATFTVLLPVPAIAPPSQTATLANVRVLLVDDDRDMLNLTELILTDAGAQVQTAMSVAAALEYWSQSPPDILISDIAMPEQNGYDLIQAVRRRTTGQLIPAIAVTAYASEAHRDDSLRAGFVEHLAKPVDPETLISVILMVLHARSQ
jgi:PAS domain S-box-containing protein